MARQLNIVIAGGPAPWSDFVEVEDENGNSVNVGQWVDQGNGLWALRLTFDGEVT